MTEKVDANAALINLEAVLSVVGFAVNTYSWNRWNHLLYAFLGIMLEVNRVRPNRNNSLRLSALAHVRSCFEAFPSQIESELGPTRTYTTIMGRYSAYANDVRVQCRG